MAAAVERDLAVFCEKPLAPTIEGCREIAAALRGRPHQVGLVLRHAPVFAAFADAVASGRYGRPMAVVFRDDQYFPIQGMYGSTWRADVTEAGGGTLIEHSIHDVDVLQWILGPVTEVSAATAETFSYPGIEDVAAVRLWFGAGATATLTSVWHQVLSRPSTRRLELFCEDAMLWTEDDYLGPVHVETSAGHEEVVGRAAGLDRPAPHARGPGQVRGPVRRSEQAVPRCPGRGGRRAAGPGDGRARTRDRRADGRRRPRRARGGGRGVPVGEGGRGGHRGGPGAAGHGPGSCLALRDRLRVREDCPMPLSEEELRILQEIEANLTATDPALVQQVSETTLYRHAARSIKWAIFGFVAGLVLLVATFTKVLVLGFVGFLVMFGVPARDRAQRPQARQGGDGQPDVVVPIRIGRRDVRLGRAPHARALAPRRHALAR